MSSELAIPQQPIASRTPDGKAVVTIEAFITAMRAVNSRDNPCALVAMDCTEPFSGEVIRNLPAAGFPFCGARPGGRKVRITIEEL